MPEQEVHLFLFNGFSDWEASHAIAGINNPQFQKNPGRYRVRCVAANETPITSVGGLRVQPDLTLDELSPANSAMLILPGGAAWDQGENTEAVAIAEKWLAAHLPVAAICGATAGLAKAGLLDTRRHTSNARDYLNATRYLGAELYDDAPAVTDGDLITASAMASVDFAHQIFKRLDLYSTPVLDAWFGLFKTGRAEYFGELMNALNA